MKKIVAFIAAVIFIVGASATVASAEEYEVQKGDNLWKIAEEYNTTVNDLIDINELKTTVIQPQQELAIYETYIVEKGDTLIGIGKQFNVTVDDLKEWNDLKADLIVIDQELDIKGGKAADKEESGQSGEASGKAKNDSKSATAAEKPKTEDKAPEGQTINVSATAYTAGCSGCSGVTYTGVDLNSNPNAKVIAVDPNVIPLGSEVYVEGYGYATAADIGGAIKGNKIDIHVPTKKEALEWGVQSVKVTILD